MASVLCLHGLTGSPDELAPIHAALAAAGCRVMTPLLAGHGADVDALAATTRSEWLATANDALSTLAAMGEPVVVIGASAGGLLGLSLAAARPHEISKLALLATPMSLSWFAASHIRMRLMLPPGARPRWLRVIPKPHGPNVSDKTLAAGLRSLAAYPLEALGQLLDLMAEARAALPLVTQPVLIVHGELDATVPRAQADALAAALVNASRIERMALPASAHLVGIDRDREVLAARLVAFAKNRELTPT